MDPQISKEHNNKFNIKTFTVSGINVSLINAIRRTLLSDIPIVVFRTAPYEDCLATIHVNTSRLNNEILKQRLSCIPIYIKNLKMNLEDYELEIDETNMTDTIQYITTEHFKIKNTKLGKYLSDEDTRIIFPANILTEHFIDFARLRPNISEELSGERIHLTCKFCIGYASESSMFNVVSCAAYGNTLNETRVAEEFVKQKQIWRDQELTEEVVKMKEKDWMLIDACRFYITDSFDFSIQSVGVFTNDELLATSCKILIHQFEDLRHLIDLKKLEITVAENTMQNCFDIILENEDYTIGKVLEYMLHMKYFKGVKTLSYCGYTKMHPHDTSSIIRVAYKKAVNEDIIIQNLLEVIKDAVIIYKNLKSQFHGEHDEPEGAVESKKFDEEDEEAY
jgi:DNA-directed RNA polymerase subunit L